MFFAIPIKGFDRPALQVSCEDPICGPLHVIGNQHRIGAGEFLIFKTDDQVHLAQSWNPNCHGEGPVRLIAHLHWPVGMGGDERHQVFYADMRSFQGNVFAIGVLERTIDVDWIQ